MREGDYTKVSGIVGKIKLLLTYWAFLDFGLTTADFLQCLKTTQSELRFIARLDDVHLARVTGTATFFQVTAENLNELKQTKGIRVLGCFIREEDGSFRFSRKYARMYKDWQHAPSRTARVQSAKAIFGIDDAAARLLPHAYFENEGDLLEVHHMWMVNREAIVE